MKNWQKIATFTIFSGFIFAGLIFSFNSLNQSDNTAKASSLNKGFYAVNQILISPDNQVSYVRGGGNSDGTTGIKKVDANTNTDLGVSLNYTNNAGYDMVLSQDGCKLYLILFNNVKVLNSSDLSLIASINVDSLPSGARDRCIIN